MGGDIMKNITISDVNKDHLRIVTFLVVSGGLGYVLATYIAKDPILTAVFAPAINYILWIIKKEIEGNGYIEAIKEKK